jgi:glutamate mutase epsilon subunit
MEYKKDCYESGKMLTKVGMDYLQALKRRHYIYQTIFQNENGPIPEEEAKAYSIWEIYFYDFSENDKQVVVCVS